MELENQEKVEDHVLKRYKLIEKVGSGSYGHVWKALCLATKQTVALKKIFDAFRNVKDAQRTYREISILKKLERHPNLVQLKEILPAHNDRDIYLVFDYMECDLFSVMREHLMKEAHVRFVIAQVTQALMFLHECDIVHRDLKPANILINSDCRIKLCDFGLSRFLSVRSGEELNMTEFVATRWYRSPEIIFGSRSYTKHTDMWSFGCIIGQILAEKPMFNGKTAMDQLEKIMMFVGQPSAEELTSLKCEKPSDLLQNIKVRKMPPGYWFKEANPDAVDLVYKLLKFNPTQRLTPEQVLNHPFVRDYVEMTQCHIHGRPLLCDINDNIRLPVQQYRQLIYKMIGATNRREVCPSLKSPTDRPRKRSKVYCRSQQKPKEKQKIPQQVNKQNLKPLAKDSKSCWADPKQRVDKIYSSKVSLHCSPSVGNSLNSSVLGSHSQAEGQICLTRKQSGIYKKIRRRNLLE